MFSSPVGLSKNFQLRNNTNYHELIFCVISCSSVANVIMKKRFFSFLLIFSFVFSVAAQKAKTTDASEKNLRAHVEYLASEQLEGRRTGEQGAVSAAGYISNMLANYKLKPGVASPGAGSKMSGNFLQSFPFVAGVEIAARGNELRLDVTKPDGKKLELSSQISFKPIGFSPNGAVADAPIVFAGYGIVSAEAKYDDYAGRDVRGKVVLVFDGAPLVDTPHSSLARFDVRAKAKIAKDKGATGLLVISREAKLEDDKLAQLTFDQTLGEAALPTLVIARSTAAGIFGTEEKKLSDIEHAVKIGSDPAIRVDVKINAKAVAGFIVNLVKKNSTAYNIIGVLEGRDEQLKNEAIIIGAHYDHLGRGGQGSLTVNSKEIHHGADDNASGVAAMLELARHFAQAKTNKRTLIFIAFGGEEEGLLGSKYYVNNPVFPLDKTIAMINMDMVGRLKDDKLTVGGIGTAKEWKNWIEYRNAQPNSSTNPAPVNLPKPKIPMEAQANSVTANSLVKEPIFNLQLNEDGFGPSDHSSFYGKQIPILFFFTGTHVDYHKPTDTAEKINYNGLLKITNFVEEIVNALAQNSYKPTYAVAKSSGTGESRRGFNVSLGTVPSYAEGANDGLTLDAVRDSSPAAKAGIKAGDKIIKLAGSEIRNVSDYVYVLGEMKAGTEYEIVVLRGGKPLTLKIIAAPRQ